MTSKKRTTTKRAAGKTAAAKGAGRAGGTSQDSDPDSARLRRQPQ